MAVGRRVRLRAAGEPAREALEGIAAEVLRSTLPRGPMPPAAAHGAGAASVDFATFKMLWKRLVSKRKARKYNVRRDDVWHQLRDGALVLEADPARDPQGERDDIEVPLATGKRGRSARAAG